MAGSVRREREEERRRQLAEGRVGEGEEEVGEYEGGPDAYGGEAGNSSDSAPDEDMVRRVERGAGGRFVSTASSSGTKVEKSCEVCYVLCPDVN